jgi:hypothetical protein
VAYSTEKLDAQPPQESDEISRLMAERNELLESGLYTRQDRLIGEMDARIEKLLRRRQQQAMYAQ